MDRLPFLITAFALLLGLVPLHAQTTGMARVKGGTYIPLYGVDSTAVDVVSFEMDVYPVTNAQFLEFVKQNPKWRRSQAKRLFTDGNYLVLWEGDLSLGEDLDPNSPVTNISWFAAKNYCECQGKRLPTVDEWEYVAMADESLPDARGLETYNQKILDWYEAPRTFERTIGSTFKNYWGIYDLHGLVWEWNMDFNSVLITGESRKDRNLDNTLFCGGAAIGASDLMNYAAFMRYAFRGSLTANYSGRNLGFRCVRPIAEDESKLSK